MRIPVAEQGQALCAFLERSLEAENYAVDLAPDSEAAKIHHRADTTATRAREAGEYIADFGRIGRRGLRRPEGKGTVLRAG